jgi:hypothetical protein
MSKITPKPESIAQLVFLIRWEKVLLSQSLTELYGVSVSALNQAVKRTHERFPEDFMFQLTGNEFENLKSQIVTSSWGGLRCALPYAFTEQGVAKRQTDSDRLAAGGIGGSHRLLVRGSFSVLRLLRALFDAQPEIGTGPARSID